MTNIERIAQLLVNGMAPALVASVVGVSKTYVSQLMSDPDFKEALKELSAQNNENPITNETQLLNDKMTGLSHATIDQLLTQVSSGMVGARDLVFTLNTINTIQESAFKRDAMKKGLANAGLGAIDGVSVRVVEITMPAVCAPELTIGPNSEVISIGNRSTAPMPAATLQKMLEAESKPAIEGESYYEQAVQC